MSLSSIITLARNHVSKAQMGSSARLCLADAIKLFDEGRFPEAKVRALKSLAYSIGILHPDYERASK